MSRLADIIHESIAAVEVAGRPISTHAAAKYGVARIIADAELNYPAVLEWLTVKIQAVIKRSTRRAGLLDPREYVMAHRAGLEGAEGIAMIIPRQGDLFIDPFELNDGHMLEGGTGEMHRTRYATMPDFEGFIRIRDKQIAADIKYANKMRRARERLTPIWSVDPMMTYREACDFYVRQHGMPVDVDEDDGEEGGE